MACRNCGNHALSLIIDLGASPHSNAYIRETALDSGETWYPLAVYRCAKCHLVQTSSNIDGKQLFHDEYAYFSGYSSTWIAHAHRYSIQIQKYFSTQTQLTAVEIASNDGTFLEHLEQQGFEVLGIEPTRSTAEVAQKKGIKTIREFFGVELAEQLKADGVSPALMVANNVLAHVPDINDFIKGFQILLADSGIATFEFPLVSNLIEKNQFDTIYHEHFSYLSVTAATAILQKNGLIPFRCELIDTHGGSARIFVQKIATGVHPVDKSVADMTRLEEKKGVKSRDFYSNFASRCIGIKYALLNLLLKIRSENKTVVAYGAAAKGNTLLNYCGIRPDLISYVVDLNPNKQGMYLPGSRIPIVAEKKLPQTKPDYILILPWNLKDEISEQLTYVREWGARFIIAVPSVEVL